MIKQIFFILGAILFLLASAASVHAQDCVSCHQKISPSIVTDWQLSKHNARGIGCPECHGTNHKTETDAAQAQIWYGYSEMRQDLAEIKSFAADMRRKK